MIDYLAAFRMTTCAEISDEYSNTILISNSLSNDDLICRNDWDSSKFRCSRASEKAIFFSQMRILLFPRPDVLRCQTELSILRLTLLVCYHGGVIAVIQVVSVPTLYYSGHIHCNNNIQTFPRKSSDGEEKKITIIYPLCRSEY